MAHRPEGLGRVATACTTVRPSSQAAWVCLRLAHELPFRR